ncbi:FtsQ-type POTRA domain-containing protein [Bacillus sp. AGMB 02131]|uniref:Cell division protein DivIB n=1 Tax=Peribacillus faecalis TaxID=2772559 RepID=A0A927H8S6_9BACI|nr:FtsQ-type POTRA domain-containing protein [Peribacillus faecalis]MBD3106820.1 FtsQ-type POTRA domain-containing protein [Peribacillus faecalis]
MEKENVVSLEDRIPKLKQRRKKKANRRAIALLSVFFLLLIFVLYFLSPLSNVNKINIQGNVYTSENIIVESSGLSTDTTIWKVDKEEILERLKQLPEIKEADISIILPNSVQIKVEEYKRLAYLVDGSVYKPILSSGKIMESAEVNVVPVHAPLLFGFGEGKELDSVIAALEELPEEINNAISEIHFNPSETDSYRVKLYMNDGYEVSANSRTLADKLVHYPSIVSQLEPNVKGVIDLEVGSYFRAYESSEPQSE